MIKGASEEILEAQYCAAGDYEGWLVHCASKKLRALRSKHVTTEEYAALVARNWAILNKGNSDGSF